MEKGIEREKCKEEGLTGIERGKKRRVGRKRKREKIGEKKV